MKIVPTSRLDCAAVQEATEKYSGQVRPCDDHRSLVGYVAGQLFPLMEANDPYVAQKIARNNQFRPLLGGDYDLRYFDSETVYGGGNKAYDVIYDIAVGHYSGYSYGFRFLFSSEQCCRCRCGLTLSLLPSVEASTTPEPYEALRQMCSTRSTGIAAR